MTYLLETDSDSDGRYLTDVLRSISDEVAAHLMTTYRGHSRELAMVLAKVDEARMWAIEHGLKTGSLVLIDKRRLIPIQDTEENGASHI